MNHTVDGIIARWAELAPNASAIAAPGRETLSYGALHGQMLAAARWLAMHGVDRHDRIALVLPQGAEAAVAFVSVASTAIAAPLNPNLREAEYRAVFEELAPAAVIVPFAAPSAARDSANQIGIDVLELESLPRNAGEFALRGERRTTPSMLAPSKPDDVALILPTSGTTSRSKLVPLTHANVSAAAANTSQALGLRSSDRCLNPMPLFHGHGLIAGVLSALTAGSSVMCTPPFAAQSFFAWMEEFEPTWYTAVPAIHRAVSSEAANHSHAVVRRTLRFIRSASSLLSRDVQVELERTFGVLVTESYGLSEALQLTNTPLNADARKLGSLGVPGSSQVAIMDADGAFVPPGREGEIVCRGPVVMSGYLNRPDENRDSFLHGWFRTGDLGRLDSDGHLYMSGRIKEQINRAGEKISPSEIDLVVAEHPAIAQVVTFGLPEPAIGEEIAVAAVLRPGAIATPQDIRRFAHERLPDFKVPRRVFIVPSIPVSAMGKPLRRSLVEMFKSSGPTLQAETQRPDVLEPATPLEQQLTRIWENVLQRNDVSATDDFFDIGGDSLRAAQIMVDIQHARGKLLQPSVLFAAPTIRDLAHHIENQGDTDIAHRPLIEVQRGEERPPFVFLPGDYNRMALYCRNIARRLDPRVPFYVLMPHQIENPDAPQTIEAMAAAFLETVRASYPQGPYYLGGFSHAGLIAFEMARQLEARGETAAVVFVIDMPVGSPRLRLLRRAVDAAGRIARLSDSEAADLFITWRDRAERFWELQRLGVRQLLGYYAKRLFGWRPRPAAHTVIPAHLEQIAAAFNRVVRRYVPGQYSGHVTLVASEHGPARHHIDATMGWGKVASAVTVRGVPGDHWSCVTEHAETVAAHLQASIDQAYAERTPQTSARGSHAAAQFDTQRGAAVATYP